MQTLPHTGGLPGRQSAVRGRWRAAHLRGKMPPRDPREQHEHDRVEAHTIIHTRTPATRIQRTLREQRPNRLPQLVPHPPPRAPRPADRAAPRGATADPPPTARPAPAKPSPPQSTSLTGLCHPERFDPQRPSPPPRGIETASKTLRPRAGGRTCFALPGTPAIRVAARAVSSPGVTLDLARLLELRERLGNGRPAAPGSGCDLRRCQL